LSQPVALIALVSLDEASFKRFVRSRAAKDLATCIADALAGDLPSYCVFRYLKPRSTLFAFFYFNHGNAPMLAESRELAILHGLGAFAGAGEAGYILAHLDALNLGPDDMADAWRVVDGKCERVGELPASVWAGLHKDCAKYFYKEADTDFALNLSKKRIVDKSIVNRCQAIMEARRVEKLGTQLHRANFGHPLHFFGDYYFNGEFIYHLGRDITLLREIDPVCFHPMPYGGADNSHIVVDGVMRKLDVATFEKMQKGEKTFFKDASCVYDHNLLPLDGADPHSFRLTTDYYAEDASSVYFAGLTIPKAELGPFKFYPAGYFHAQKLLIGEQAVYLGSTRLAVDPASFHVEETRELHRGTAFDIAYVARDKNAAYLLTSTMDSTSRALVIQTDDPDVGIVAVHEAHKTERNTDSGFPPSESQGKATLDNFRTWADKHLDRLYGEYRYRDALGGSFESVGWFYRGVNNFLHLLFQAGQYEELLATYSKICDTAWLNPHLFHHTACAYAALGRADEAIKEVRKALVFGYPHMDKIWSDEDLAVIRDDPRFRALQEAFGDDALPAAPYELVLAIAGLPDEFGPEMTSKLVTKFKDRFLFPTLHMVQGWIDDTAPTDEPRREWLTRYADALRFIYGERLLCANFSSSEHEFYQRYMNHADLHPLVHLRALEFCFRKAHFSGGLDGRYMKHFREALQRAHQALDAGCLGKEENLLNEALAENAFLAYVVDRIRTRASFA
jgi:hypothetical protein